ncbi:hypothetical protein KJ966_29345 [bacterium]|nr:hypothetical protein [bacterium]
MEKLKYDDIKAFVHDDDLIKLLCYDKTSDELFEDFVKDDFLKIDSGMKIPFFAEIRDYRGAIEKNSPESQWLVKPIKGKDVIESAMAMISFFMDLFTHTLSVPVIVTKIDNVLYKATKLINKAEQLSGANYTVYPELIEQLVLDIVNRWITYDEDRNPNNYLIKYNSKNQNLVLAIDFGNCDLLYKDIKIKGLAKGFGWQKKEKTRYLTPLKTDNFVSYGMDFYNIRFDYFRKMDSKTLYSICKKALRFDPDKDTYSKTITNNILRRINYVYKYFAAKLPETIEKKNDYNAMGKTFQQM